MATDAEAPLISIGIPTYNRADTYLRDALESALAQTWAPLEIVVSDNDSTDATEATVRSYNDPRVRYYRQKPAVAPNDNFNFCLAQARGDYFLLLHDDDKIDPDFVETCIKAASYRTDCALIRTGVRLINPKGEPIQVSPNDVRESFTDLFAGWFNGRTAIYLCSTLFNTRMLKDAGAFRSRHNLFQDVAAIARLASRGEVVNVRAPKASARLHGEKWGSAARIQAWCEDALDLLDLVCTLTTERRDELRENGARFFAKSNYRRASRIRDRADRWAAYRLVYRLFGGRYWPSARTVCSNWAVYRGLRRTKRRLLRLPAWVD